MTARMAYGLIAILGFACALFGTVAGGGIVSWALLGGGLIVAVVALWMRP